MGSQKITMPQLLHNATWQSDHHTQQCQLQKVSQSHQAIVRQHMCAKWKQQPDVDRELAAQSDQIQDSTMGSVPQIRQQWHGQTITEQSRGVTAYRSIKQFIRIHPRCRKSNENPTKAYQKTEVLNQNPMKIRCAASSLNTSTTAFFLPLPDHWKLARAVMIYKRGGKNSRIPSAYRPTSLANSILNCMQLSFRHGWPIILKTASVTSSMGFVKRGPRVRRFSLSSVWLNSLNGIPHLLTSCS